MLGARALLPSMALATTLAVILPGCIGDDADSPLDNALGYLPEDAPLVITAGTNPNNRQFESALDIVEKFPFGKQFVARLGESVSGNVDYEKDVKPILGNDVVIGAQNAAAINNDNYLASLEVKDTDKAEQLVKTGSKDVGEAEGTTVYQDDDTFAALHEDVLLLSNAKDNIGAAIKRRDEDDRFSEDKFDDAFEQLPKDSLASAYVDVRAFIEQSEGENADRALKVKWVGAIESLALTGTVQEDGIDVGIFVNTDASALSPSDIPLATGSQPPKILEPGADSPEISVGIRDPATSVRFGLEAARQASSGGFADFEAGLKQIGSATGVDLQQDIVAQFSGDTSVAIQPTGEFAFRSGVEDASALETTLAKLVSASPRLAKALGFEKIGRSAPKEGGELYALSTDDGARIAFGVIKGAFVAGNEAALVAEAAGRPLTDVPGAAGALVASVDAQALARELIAKSGGIEARLGGALFTAPLGALRGSLEASADGLRGSIHLEIK